MFTKQQVVQRKATQDASVAAHMQAVAAQAPEPTHETQYDPESGSGIPARNIRPLTGSVGHLVPHHPHNSPDAVPADV
jgi:hypothetical protein